MINISQPLGNTKEGETTIVVLEDDVLFTISIEDACLYTSSCSIDWILDYGASYHVTPCKANFVAYKTGDYDRVHL